MLQSIKISKRGQSAPASPIRKLSFLAEKVKQAGKAVYHLNIGQPDFLLPLKISQNIKKHSQTNYLPYALSEGVGEIRAEWSLYYKKIGLDLLAEDIFVTSGASEGIIFALAAVCDPGEEVLVFEPCYANYLGFSNLAGVETVPITLDKKSGYHLPKDDEIIRCISKKTKAIIINNPNNPTGTVFTDSELKRLLKIARAHNLFLISDEAYFGITFDSKVQKSLFSLASKSQRNSIIIIDSVSKRLNACGARIGIIATSNPDLKRAFSCFSQQRLSVATLDQMIIKGAMLRSIEYVKKITKEYQKRRDVFVSELSKYGKVIVHNPEGAFYCMIELPLKDADDFAKWMLEKFDLNGETVMVAPGSGFYASENKGKNEIRVAFVLESEKLRKAAKILVAGIEKYCELHGTTNLLNHRKYKSQTSNI